MFDPAAPPKLLPTRSLEKSSTLSVVAFGLGKVVLLGLLLVAVLSMVTSCTIPLNVVLYQTNNFPTPRATPWP